MISIARINARGQNQKGDNIDYLWDAEYYVDKSGEEVSMMRWGGKLAADEMLQLAGKPVAKDAMTQLARGFSPSGEPLCQNAGELPTERVKTHNRGPLKGQPMLDEHGKRMTVIEGGHRVGFDLTFSAPKSVSVAFAVARGQERDELLEAHRAAVQKSMDWLESKVETRRGHAGKDVIDTEGLIYTQVDHMANRDLEPNLHTHTLVYGVAKGDDGKWGTFDSKELYRHRMAADQIYRNELACNLRALGYGIEQQAERSEIDGQKTGRIWWTINGMPDEALEKFSSRRKAIVEYAQEHGVDMQTACLATRRHKDEPSLKEMEVMWAETLKELGPDAMPALSELKGRPDVLEDRPTDEQILEALHRTEAVFCEHDLIEEIGNAYSGLLGREDLFQQAEEFKKRVGLVEIQGEALAEEDMGKSLSRRHTESRYAAPWMVERETEVLHRAAARQDEQHVRISPQTLHEAIEKFQAERGFQISDEQRQAVEHITVGSGGVAVLSGLAGTGKTTVSDLYSMAFQAEGKRMIGVAVSNAAAQKLEAESGMASTSMAMTLHLLSKKKMALTRDDVVVLDEAGMVETEDTRRLMAYCQDAGAKLILQGDMHQLQPVGAGSGMALVREAVGDTMLTEIRRQKRVEDRDIAAKFYDRDEHGRIAPSAKVKSRAQVQAKSLDILEALEANGNVEAFSTSGDAMRMQVKQYLDDTASERDKILLAHSRDEVAQVNAMVRAGLQARGEVSKKQVEIKCIDNREKRWVDLALAEGDSIVFGARSDDLGVVNGTRAKVEKIRKAWGKGGGYDIEARIMSDIPGEDGRVVKFNQHDYNAISHAYCTTIHGAQGQGKANVYHLLNQGMADNHASLVAFTRLTSGRYTMFGAADDIDALKDRLGLDRLKENAVKAGLKEAPVSVMEVDLARVIDQFEERPKAEQSKPATKVPATQEARSSATQIESQLEASLRRVAVAAASRVAAQEGTKSKQQIGPRLPGTSM